MTARTNAPADAPAPLAGCTIGGTAARRADELGSLLQQRGARVRHGPALRIVPLADDARLHDVTERCIADPPSAVLATTGAGCRGRVAADGAVARLRAAFGGPELVRTMPERGCRSPVEPMKDAHRCAQA